MPSSLRSLRRPLLLAGVVGASLAVAAPAMAASSGTTVTANVNTVLSVSAPASLGFGAVDPGDNPSSSAAVTVVSNVSNGYTLTASRTAFTPDEIPLAFSGVTGTPANASAGSAGAIPTSGSITIGTGAAGFVTPQAGAVWNVGLSLGPVGFIRDGVHSSTVTFTATATP